MYLLQRTFTTNDCHFSITYITYAAIQRCDILTNMSLSHLSIMCTKQFVGLGSAVSSTHVRYFLSCDVREMLSRHFSCAGLQGSVGDVGGCHGTQYGTCVRVYDGHSSS